MRPRPIDEINQVVQNRQYYAQTQRRSLYNPISPYTEGDSILFAPTLSSKAENEWPHLFASSKTPPTPTATVRLSTTIVPLNTFRACGRGGDRTPTSPRSAATRPRWHGRHGWHGRNGWHGRWYGRHGSLLNCRSTTRACRWPPTFVGLGCATVLESEGARGVHAAEGRGMAAGPEQRLNPEERANLVAYIDGELTEHESRVIATKLTQSATARREVDSLKKTWELLEYLPRPQASEAFPERTLTSIRSIETRGVAWDRGRGRGPRGREAGPRGGRGGGFAVARVRPDALGLARPQRPAGPRPFACRTPRRIPGGRVRSSSSMSS